MFSYRAANQNDIEHSSSDEETTEIRHRGSNGSYASSSSLESSTPFTKRKFQAVSLKTFFVSQIKDSCFAIGT